jgi:hypothetical protein
MNHYLKYAKNIFSQNGEDGIIEYLLNLLEIKEGILCEFGSWDGIYLSNTANLFIFNKNYKAILIEADTQKYEESKNIFKNFDTVEIFNCKIDSNSNSPNSINNILKRSKFEINNDNFVLISIDVDSIDYHIFESLTEYNPKIVIVETNSSYTEEVVSIGGSSLKSLTKLANRKNYTLICSTGNAFFIRNDLISKLPIIDDNITMNQDGVDQLTKINSNGIKIDNLYFLTKEYNDFLNKIKRDLS